VKIGLIGAGTMGSNHARVVSLSQEEELSLVFDIDSDSVARLLDKYGGQEARDLEELTQCDAVVIASPTQLHYEQASLLLEAKIPLLVEKPLSSTLEEVKSLSDLALRNETVLLCGFVERFNPSVRLAMELLTEDAIHIMTQRHSPADGRKLGSVVNDLLIHDIDLALRFLGKRMPILTQGSAWNSSHGQSEIADCILKFENESLATLSASRMGQRKIRTISILSETNLIEVDLLRADVTVYKNIRQEQPSDTKSLTYRSETVIDIPFVRHAGEPLALEHEHFLRLIRGEADPVEEVESILGPHSVADEIQRQCEPSKKIQEL
jgi:predicted dehydrogenase